MGYLKIPNLYRDKRILLFKECFCLEKIHGTSSSISFNNDNLIFFPGGEKYENFIKLFNHDELKLKFLELGKESITIFGEAYGGRCQGMSSTYGPNLKFCAFDVKIGEFWLNVTNANDVVNKLGLEFVDYIRVPATIESLEIEKLKPSIQSKRNNILENKEREGIVIRPIEELIDQFGNRIITKHKNDSFTEVKVKRELTTEDLKILSDAEKIAEDWVTPMRLNHVLDKFPQDVNVEQTSDVIQAMLADIKKESEGEIVWSKTVNKYISTKTAVMFKNKLKQNLLES